MDARTRERLPLRPVLVRSVDDRRADAERLLAAARHTPAGDTFTASGQTLTRSVTRKPTMSVWADDPVTGKRRDLTREEDHAFWTWAVIEVLRSTGVRVEELLELSHHSLVQYRLPSTGELVPLPQVAPSKTDTERLPVVSPDLAEVLSAVINRLQQSSGSIPLITAYDANEHLWLPPAPVRSLRTINSDTPPQARDLRPQLRQLLSQHHPVIHAAHRSPTSSDAPAHSAPQPSGQTALRHTFVVHLRSWVESTGGIAATTSKAAPNATPATPISTRRGPTKRSTTPMPPGSTPTRKANPDAAPA